MIATASQGRACIYQLSIYSKEFTAQNLVGFLQKMREFDLRLNFINQNNEKYSYNFEKHDIQKKPSKDLPPDDLIYTDFLIHRVRILSEDLSKEDADKIYAYFVRKMLKGSQSYKTLETFKQKAKISQSKLLLAKIEKLAIKIQKNSFKSTEQKQIEKELSLLTHLVYSRKVVPKEKEELQYRLTHFIIKISEPLDLHFKECKKQCGKAYASLSGYSRQILSQYVSFEFLLWKMVYLNAQHALGQSVCYSKTSLRFDKLVNGIFDRVLSAKTLPESFSKEIATAFLLDCYDYATINLMLLKREENNSNKEEKQSDLINFIRYDFNLNIKNILNQRF